MPLQTHANALFFIFVARERQTESREIINCVSLANEGEALTSPYSLPRCSASPCCCFSHWTILTFTYSVMSAVTAGVFMCACAGVCIRYDKEPLWNHSLLSRLVDFSPHQGVEFICRSKIVICKCGHFTWKTINSRDWNIYCVE